MAVVQLCGFNSTFLWTPCKQLWGNFLKHFFVYWTVLKFLNKFDNVDTTAKLMIIKLWKWTSCAAFVLMHICVTTSNDVVVISSFFNSTLCAWWTLSVDSQTRTSHDFILWSKFYLFHGRASCKQLWEMSWNNFLFLLNGIEIFKTLFPTN